MPRPLPLFGEVATPATHRRLTVAAKGFRTFFLLAAVFAVAIVPLWLAMLQAVVRPSGFVAMPVWHAHEMIFGFTVAVIAGFLLTAVGNWTQRETVTGVPLLALGGLWALGRLAMTPAVNCPPLLAALVELAFLPALIAVLARPIVATNNRRNYAMLVLLAALFAANTTIHLGNLGLIDAAHARTASIASVDVVLLIIAVIAGRVFPMFTRNATGATTIRSHRTLDVAAIATLALLTCLDVALPDSIRLTAAIAGVAGLLAGARAWNWGAQHSLRQPLVWILHAGYAWLVLGLLLRCAVGFGSSMPSAIATHALTIGTIGGLTLGMMARVSLGHTGRLLEPSRAMTWAFAAINGAALSRVVGPWLPAEAYLASLHAAGVLWTIAFLTFLVVYTPILLKPRVDGKPG